MANNLHRRPNLITVLNLTHDTEGELMLIQSLHIVYPLHTFEKHLIINFVNFYTVNTVLELHATTFQITGPRC